MNEWVHETINEWLSDIATDLARAGIDLAVKYIKGGLDIDKVPVLNYLMLGAMALAAAVFILTLYSNIIQAWKAIVTEEDVNWLRIVADAVIAAAMAGATVPIIRYAMVPVSNEIVEWLGKAPVTFNVSIDALLLQLSPHNEIFRAGFHILFGFLVWAIFMIALAISQMITYAELVIALIIGPIIAARSHGDREMYIAYWKEVFAIVFTPVIRMMMLVIVLSMVGKGTFEGLLWSLGFLIVAVMGPHILKGYLHRTGTSSAIVGGGKWVIFRLGHTVLRGGGKK